MTRSLAAVAHEVDGRLIGADAAFGPVVTDTRKSTTGALFVAIRGENFDGNDFVPAAQEHGAAGALVSRHADVALPQIEVPDTRRALGTMARAWRRNFNIPVIAVTGSAGKTTVKELVASILSVEHRVCVTEGNLNNDIGVPLTLMRLEPDDDALVVELGANHAGEIAYLAGLVEPTIAVITNAGAAHLEGFGSLRGVAEAKGELLDELPLAGTAVLNADDRFFIDWRTRTTASQILSFGLSESADCRVVGEPEFRPDSTRFVMLMPGDEELEIELPLIGIANVRNALAAAAAAAAAGAPTRNIREGLERIRPVRGRLSKLAGLAGATVIDDSYNANPTAARAALDYLAALPGTRIFVLGDMYELGPEAAELHREVGEYARDRCDQLIAFGKLAGLAAQAFGPGASSFDEIDDLRTEVTSLLADDVTVLVKGSRAMGLERLVAALIDPEAGEPVRC